MHPLTEQIRAWVERVAEDSDPVSPDEAMARVGQPGGSSATGRQESTRRWLAAAVVVLIVGVAGGLALLARDGQESPATTVEVVDSTEPATTEPAATGPTTTSTEPQPVTTADDPTTAKIQAEIIVDPTVSWEVSVEASTDPPGWICVYTTVGSGSGGGCNPPDADLPAPSASYDFARGAGPVEVVTVSAPQGRIVYVHLTAAPGEPGVSLEMLDGVRVEDGSAVGQGVTVYSFVVETEASDDPLNPPTRPLTFSWTP